MPVSGSSVLTWRHRALTGALKTGSRLFARAAALAGCGGRPTEQPPVPIPGADVWSGSSAQPSSQLAPTVTVRAPETPTTSDAREQQAVSARAGTAPLPSAMGRRVVTEFIDDLDGSPATA